MNFIYIILIIVVSASVESAYAQDNKSPCSLPESKQFDFWLGEWNLSWKDADGKDLSGTNKINKILDGCVIQENFETADGTFKGTSVSLYNQRLNKWQQTWVDNAGAYLDFTGEFSNDRMELSRDAKDKNGNPIKLRMIFYNITNNEFDWNWEKSDDNGSNWKVLWKIHYKRKV